MFQKITSKNNDNQPAATPPRPAQQQPQAPAAAGQQPAAQPQGAPAESPRPGAAAGQRNILSNDVTIKGAVRFQNDLLVDGRIEGEIASTGSLTVAENAHLQAEIKTKSVVIYGKVHGNITATERIEVKANAEMVGDLRAPLLSIEPGAIFVGKSETGKPSIDPSKVAQKAPEKSNGNAAPAAAKGAPANSKENPKQGDLLSGKKS